MLFNPLLKTLAIKFAGICAPQFQKIIIRQAAVMNRGHGYFFPQKSSGPADGKIDAGSDRTVIPDKDGISRILLTYRLLLRGEGQSRRLNIQLFGEPFGFSQGLLQLLYLPGFFGAKKT